MSHRIIGVDDAGRGCVIGPLVICGISVEEDLVGEFVDMGIKDSKMLKREKRERLYDTIMSLGVKYEVVKIPPRKIDVYVKRKKKHEKLNKLEAMNMAEVINRLEGDTAIIDACDTNISVFYDQVYERLEREVRLVVAHKADRLYPVVSAASIIAKVERDREIDALRKRYGDFGSGYPSDRKTVKFLESWLESYSTLPPIVRKSWKTVRRLRNPPS